jgi:hypothetical protein
MFHMNWWMVYLHIVIIYHSLHPPPIHSQKNALIDIQPRIQIFPQFPFTNWNATKAKVTSQKNNYSLTKVHDCVVWLVWSVLNIHRKRKISIVLHCIKEQHFFYYFMRENTEFNFTCSFYGWIPIHISEVLHCSLFTFSTNPTKNWYMY